VVRETEPATASPRAEMARAASPWDSQPRCSARCDATRLAPLVVDHRLDGSDAAVRYGPGRVGARVLGLHRSVVVAPEPDFGAVTKITD
jgi:hypothetical protein